MDISSSAGSHARSNDRVSQYPISGSGHSCLPHTTASAKANRTHAFDRANTPFRNPNHFPAIPSKENDDEQAQG